MSENREIALHHAISLAVVGYTDDKDVVAKAKEFEGYLNGVDTQVEGVDPIGRFTVKEDKYDPIYQWYIKDAGDHLIWGRFSAHDTALDRCVKLNQASRAAAL